MDRFDCTIQESVKCPSISQCISNRDRVFALPNSHLGWLLSPLCYVLYNISVIQSKQNDAHSSICFQRNLHTLWWYTWDGTEHILHSRPSYWNWGFDPNIFTNCVSLVNMTWSGKLMPYIPHLQYSFELQTLENFVLPLYIAILSKHRIP